MTTKKTKKKLRGEIKQKYNKTKKTWGKKLKKLTKKLKMWNN